MKPKEYFINPWRTIKPELIITLDETLSVWKSNKGYFWYDKFICLISECFFKTEADAIKDATEFNIQPFNKKD